MPSTTSSTLAIHGGKPVRASLLPYGRQAITDDDIAAVADVLRSDWLTTGPKVTAFEEAFAAAVDARWAVSFSSGTAGLHACAFAAEIGAGDEAITVPLTFCATSNAVIYQGGTPIFADVNARTLTLDAESAAARVTSRTKAILPVHYAGQPADLDAVHALANKHNLVVIEDAAHALGAEHAGRKIGGISHMSVFSFHPVKHLTTGEGGMVTTNDEQLARRLRQFRGHGIDRDARQREASGTWYYEMAALGYNYRLTDIASALGLSQLPRLAANVERRSEMAAKYCSALAGTPAIAIPAVDSNVRHAWHLFPIRICQPIDRNDVFNALRAEGIGVNVHYVPVHLHPYYRERFGYAGGECPNAEAASSELISLPMFFGMTNDDVDDVVAAVTKVMTHFAGEPA